jgi:GNAT superfamily N-acetyltransferase
VATVVSTGVGRLRRARAEDGVQLVDLWARLFDPQVAGPEATWRSHAQAWFAEQVDEPLAARFPVVEVGERIVACAVGALELGVPNPWCPRGRTVRLANLITTPAQRGRGFGTALVSDVLGWARSIGADRVDLSATPDGGRIYEKLGFEVTSAPRMKLVLHPDV